MQDIEKLSPELQNISSQPIRDLGLKLEESPVHRYVQQLYRELDRKGVKKFRPQCYLMTSGDARPESLLSESRSILRTPTWLALKRELNDLETTREIMMYLRHEAGHAFNYAYKLYNTPEWKQLFGPFRRPYRDNYRPIPFSRNYVRHLAGWYAQKHPDEDFAETFAVWLTPRSGWRKRYRGWGAMEKLRYMDRIARELGDVRRDSTSRPNGRDG